MDQVLYYREADGTIRLPPTTHHIDNLLQMSPDDIMANFISGQRSDFLSLLDNLGSGSDPLYGKHSDVLNSLLNEITDKEKLKSLFLDLHDHVMNHPVWLHPFFRRFFEGNFNAGQLKLFALHYFNQIKNTRQCVALSLGRFSGFSPRIYDSHTERIQELTQVVLAQLLADEYGVSTEALEHYPDLRKILGSSTHIVMYRKLLFSLGIPLDDQDVPMLHGVADNVLIQRLMAGNPAFSELESLASVGLGMEWGVPEFFSLLLGGLIRFAANENLTLNPEDVIVLTAHVKYDVLHAIAVMFVTSFFLQSEDDLRSVKNAVNTLMAGRYGMMTDLYGFVFGENCPALNQIELNKKYHVNKEPILSELIQIRRKTPEKTVLFHDLYIKKEDHPFVFP